MLTETAKFTPGPWTFESYCFGSPDAEIAKKEIVGPVQPDTHRNLIAEIHMRHDAHEADGHLIAAAPDMFAALEAVEGGLTGLLIDYERTDPHSFSASNIRADLFKLRAAIKKAKGE